MFVNRQVVQSQVKSRVKMRPEVLHIRVGLPGAGVVQLR